jgi:hypothetical protein
MKTYGGLRYSSTILKVSGQLHGSATLHLWKYPPMATVWRLGRPQSWSRHYEGTTENFFSLLRIKPQFLLHSACTLARYCMSYTAWAHLRNCQHVTLGILVVHVECSQVVYHSITMYSSHTSFRNASHAAQECEGGELLVMSHTSTEISLTDGATVESCMRKGPHIFL